MEINKILNNTQNMYFGHGTGTEDSKVIQSIMKYGLRCSHGSLYFTSIALGIGSQIAESEHEMLKKWPHNDSKIIVIVSLPLQYKIIDLVGTATYNQGDAAFYYIPDEVTRKKFSLTNSPYVMPEFIVGYYDARNDSFTSNPIYYENLQEHEQSNLLNKVKENYFNIIDSSWGIEGYKDVIKELGWGFGLTEEELKKIQRRKQELKLMSQLPSELLNRNLKLPNGESMPARRYIEEIVMPYLPITDYVYLTSGTKIPISHFIMECVVYDCQERYNGDFAKYIQENVLIEETLTQNEKSERSK
ncbi:MAG: hypothetical protein ACI32H_05625 [Bacilli bacterium]